MSQVGPMPTAVPRGRTALGAQWRMAIVLAVPVLGLAPWLPWMLTAWGSSPLDTWGWVFLILAALWWLLVAALLEPTDSGADRRELDPAAWAPLAAFAALWAVGLAVDVRVLVAAATLGLAWSAAWLLLGGTLGLLLIPSLVLAGLSLPTSGFLSLRVWQALGFAPMSALALKSLLACLALVGGVLVLLYRRRGRLPRLDLARSSYLVVLGLALAGIGVGLSPPAFGPPLALKEDVWAFGRWLGAEIPTSPAERELFSASRRLSKRLYGRPEGGQVSVLIVESPDAHDLHAPEYCLTGSGWVIDAGKGEGPSAESAPLPLSIGSASELSASRGAHRLAGVYWFSSPSRSTSDLAGLRLQSRRTPGEPFTLYLISAVDGSGDDAREALAAFLGDAPWQR